MRPILWALLDTSRRAGRRPSAAWAAAGRSARSARGGSCRAGARSPARCAGAAAAMTPALLTSRSTPGGSRPSANARTLSRSARSKRVAATDRGGRHLLAGSRARPSAALLMLRQPCHDVRAVRASSRAVSSPSPLLAPVTTASRPALIRNLRGRPLGAALQQRIQSLAAVRWAGIDSVDDPAGRRAVSVKDTDETLIDEVCSRVRGARSPRTARRSARGVRAPVLPLGFPRRPRRSRRRSTSTGLAVGQLGFARERRADGETKIRVYNPQIRDPRLAIDPHAAVEIVTDDKPFLIDSMIDGAEPAGVRALI